MAEEKKEPWLNYLALTTIVFAICATLSTFRTGGYSTKAVLYQSQASNQWAYFQAKSIKGYLHEIQRDAWELELKNIDSKNTPLLNDYQQKIEEYSANIERYEQEKDEIQKEAKDLEGDRDKAQKHSKTFGVGVIYLQISILLSSIAALLKKKMIWFFGMGLGLIGIIYFANGFLLFF